MSKKKSVFLSIAGLLIFILLQGCTQSGASLKSGKSTTLSGYSVSLVPMANADITIFDSTGKIVQTATNKKGAYSVKIDGLEPPLLISAVDKKFPNISDNSKPRGKAVAALVPAVETGKKNIANITPLTDKIVSDIAVSLSLVGAVELIAKESTEGITPDSIREAAEKNLTFFKQALVDAGVSSPESYDPVSTPMEKALFTLFGLVRHTRSYFPKSGKIAGTYLLDITFHPISAVDPLDFKKASLDKKRLQDPAITRVFIAGDSTGANNGSERYPGMGWGQAFHTVFKEDAEVMVINAAISGRSSRSYVNEGWLDMVEELILPGDYLIIQFGHNDEKCGSNPPRTRDAFDLANTGTFPNDEEGNIQGDDAMSFQRWLEKYIHLARSKKATPILLTSITRIKRDKDKKTGLFPIESSTHIVYREKSSAPFVGNYSQTTRDTAKANNVVLIDMDRKTMDFANSVGEPAWKNYWLAVDPAKYPYYKEGKTGNINKPDGTHLQEQGAQLISSLVAEGIKEESTLADLAGLLK